MNDPERLRLEREIRRLRYELTEATRSLPHLRRMVADSADGLLLLDGGLGILEANGRAAALLGVNLSGLYGQPLRRWLADPDQARELEQGLTALASGEPLLMECDLLIGDGEARAVECLARRLEEAAGTGAVWTASLRDLDERRRLRRSEAVVATQGDLIRRLRQSEERYRQFVDQLGDGLALLDGGQRFRFANPTMHAILQLAPGALQGRSLRELVADDDRETYDQLMGAILAGRPRRERLQVLNAAGERRLLELEFRPRGGTGAGRAGSTMIARDVTELTLARRQLERLAFRDRLTGLANEEGILRWLRLRLTHHPDEPLAVLWLDLDAFGRINNTFGRAAGDRLLQDVAEHLRGSLQSNDWLGRVGGDEFLLLRPGARGADAEALVAALRASLWSALALPTGDRLALDFCAGVSLHPDHGKEAETLLRHAATALSRAQSAGSGRSQIYDPVFTVRLQQELNLESRLRRALESEGLWIAYQPQVDRTGRLIGHEALLRWHDASLGPVGPDRFIPLAERTGLIQSLGQWVLEHACRQQLAWLLAGLAPPPMAVNVSPLQFDASGPPMAERVAAVLSSTGLAASQLELEITESCILPVTGLSADLDALADLGVRLAIDDFGTGFSSLASLQRLPLHRLKIDRSFISHLETSAADRVLVGTALQLGKGLGLQTLAEGVETPEQRAILAGMDCDAYQGYLFSRPLDGAACTRLLQSGGILPEATD